MQGGWIKIHRRLMAWEWWDDAVMVKAFLAILMLCNPEEYSWHGRKLKAGSFVTSRLKLADILHLTENQMRTVLSRLTETGEITVQTNNHWSIVTVKKWQEYQPITDKSPTNHQQQITDNKKLVADFSEQITDQSPTNHRPITDQSPTQRVRTKEIYPPLISKEIIPPQGETEKPKRKVFVKPTVEEVAAYCLERRNSVNPQAFFDHYEANGWKVGKNPMRDWKAAVRYWESTNKPKQPNNIPAKHPSFDYAPDESGTDESKWFQ